MTSDVDAAGRRLIHERHVECRGYLRPDGLWDSEADQTIPMARAMVAPRNTQDAKAFPHALVELVDTCHALRAGSPIAMRLRKRS